MIKKKTIILFMLMMAVAAAFAILYLEREITKEVDKYIESQKAVSYVKYSTDYYEDIQKKKDERFELITTVRDVRDMTKFAGSYYAATSGGLLKLDNDGKKIDVYTTNNGLSSSDLTACTVYHDSLYIASKDGMLISITRDGSVNNFYITGYDGKEEIMALLNQKDSLAVVYNSAILSFDGDKFTEISIDEDVNDIKDAFVYSGKIFFVSDSGTYEILSDKSHKLNVYLVDDMTAIEKTGDKTFIGSMDGVYEVDSEGNARKVLDDIYIKSVRYQKGSVAAASYSGRMHFLSENDTKEFVIPHVINKLVIVDNRLFALTSGGIYEFKDDAQTEFFIPAQTELSSNNITSLCMDDKGYIYAGTFENGIDVLNGDLTLFKNITDDNIKEINSLYFDGERIYAGQTLGAAILKDARLINKLGREEGLIGENVSCVKRIGDAVYFTTERGLSVLKDGVIKSIYAFHGLASNKAYSIEEFDGKAIVGTLGGISIVNGLKVEKNITHSDSDLSNNWITAFYKDGDRLIIGTYGGGLNVMDKDNIVRKYDISKKSININFNALTKINKKIVAGTVNNGILIFNIESKIINQTSVKFLKKDILPSNNVTSFLVFDDHILIATDKGIAKTAKEIFYEEEED